MPCSCSVAVQHGIEGVVLHSDIDGFAVLLSSLLVPLLLEGSIASLQSRYTQAGIQDKQNIYMFFGLSSGQTEYI